MRLTCPGGARGIGLALARGVAELGGDIAVLDILEEPDKDFNDLESTFGIRARYYRYDSPPQIQPLRGN